MQELNCWDFPFLTYIHVYMYTFKHYFSNCLKTIFINIIKNYFCRILYSNFYMRLIEKKENHIIYMHQNNDNWVWTTCGKYRQLQIFLFSIFNYIIIFCVAVFIHIYIQFWPRYTFSFVLSLFCFLPVELYSLNTKIQNTYTLLKYTILDLIVDFTRF